jgi:hypothetical protein
MFKDLTELQLSRREFLIYTGVILLSIFGVTQVLDMLSKTQSANAHSKLFGTSHEQNNRNFSSGPYGA